jgi:5-methyltetrahydropteroyltriglutamate--homocysteine methyltransferase
VTDGEMSKVNFLHFLKDRLAGFEPGDQIQRGAPSWRQEIEAFPEYYTEYFKRSAGNIARWQSMVCRARSATPGTRS